jgi:hypothetical protein
VREYGRIWGCVKFVSQWVDCVDCSMYLADLTSLKDKHASACDELGVLRVEVAELLPCWVLALLVDEKRAPSAKHTASRTSWLHTCKESQDVPVNFS